MAYSVVPSGGSAAATGASAPRPDIVDRAAAILAREVPPSSTVPAAVPTADGQRRAVASIDDLQRRAATLVSDLFSTLACQLRGGPPSPPAVGLSGAEEMSALPWRRPSTPAPAGASVSMPLRIENLEDHPVDISFYSSDLLSDAGRSIPSFAVSFVPATLVLGAGQHAVITAKVDVPLQSIPGAYSGLIQAAGLVGVKAVITVDVC